MSREKHLFIQNKHYEYSSLGDTCMQIFGYYTIIKNYNLDAKIIIINNKSYTDLWHDILGKDKIYNTLLDIPEEYKYGIIHKPTSKDIDYGQWASNDLIEGLLWENGFLDTKNMVYKMPLIYNCKFNCKNVFIYPEEKTDGNRIFNARFWIETYKTLKDNNYIIYYLGSKKSPVLQEFYSRCKFDYEFQPNIINLKYCVNNCSLAVGTSTGPTWFCLFSNIRQIVFQSKSNVKYWNFDRYEFSLLKKIKTIQTFDSMLKDIVHK